jgi:hypothetical protein
LLIAQFEPTRDNESERRQRLTEGALRAAALVAAGASALLLVDLSLDWHKAAVHVAGIVDVEGTSSGWHGWGFVAGVAALVLVALVAAAATPPVFSAGAAAVALAATSLAVFVGSADLPAGPVATVEDSTLWPSWLGLVFAAVAFCAALVPLAAPAPASHRVTSHEAA